MTQADDITKKIKQMNFKSTPVLRDQILSEATQAMEQTINASAHKPSVGRIIMKSRITKITAAAMILIAVYIGLHTPPTLYALEDTIEAYKSIRWLHVSVTKIFPWKEERTTEVWVECDEQGNTARIRHQVNTGGACIGPITITNNFQDEDVWLPQHNLRVLGHKNPESLLPYNTSELDPKLLFETLTEQHEQGQVIVTIDEPQEKTKPITVTVTYPPGSRSENQQKVYHIDQATKFLTRIENYEVKEEGLRLYQRREFFNYNQPIDAMMFTLDDEIPENAQTIDMTGIEEGLYQGDMTAEEITAEVVLQFFEAVIAYDFNRAGQLFSGIPGLLIEKFTGPSIFLEVLSFGPVYPDPDPDSNIMICSCKVLFEFDGVIYEQMIDEVHVRPVSGRPDKWIICGVTVLSNRVPVHEPITVPYDEADLSFEYNQPEDMIRIEQTETEIGLVQGDLTDQEVAEELTRQLFEAIIQQDYKKAGLFSSGLPGCLAEKQSILKLLKELIVSSFESPRPTETIPGSNAIVTTRKGKSEFNGQVFNFDAEVYVRPITEQPRRWVLERLSLAIIPDSEPLTVSYDGADLSAVTYDELIPGQFMRKWLVLGPMPNQVPQQIDLSFEEGQKFAFETDSLDPVNFSPKVTIGSQDYEWALVESSYKTIDLNRLDTDHGNYKTAYLWAQVEMPEEKTVPLGIGSDDGVKVWLNGNLVHENFLSRVTIFDNDQVQVPFKKGTNHLVLKVQNFRGPWSFCCRLLDE